MMNPSVPPSVKKSNAPLFSALNYSIEGLLALNVQPVKYVPLMFCHVALIHVNIQDGSLKIHVFQ